MQRLHSEVADMKPDIIIPTNKDRADIAASIAAIEATAPGCRIVYTGFRASASTNRNFGLNHAGPLVIMVDDDIQGFFLGWAAKLCAPLADKAVVMVSARLMKPDGTPGAMMDIRPDFSAEIVEATGRLLPSACVAFRNEGRLRFDEAFRGAGYEDTDYCRQLGARHRRGRFLVHNGVKLTHVNEQKGQDSENMQFNRAYYLSKWMNNQ